MLVSRNKHDMLRRALKTVTMELQPEDPFEDLVSWGDGLTVFVKR